MYECVSTSQEARVRSIGFDRQWCEEPRTYNLNEEQM